VEKRRTALEEVRTFLALYGGSTMAFIDSCGSDAVLIERALAKNMGTFNDCYRGVTFNKKARLFVAMVHGRIARLKSVEKVGGLADYQLPKLLTFERMIVLPERILAEVRLGQPLERNGESEFQIRCATVDAIAEISSKVPGLSPLKLDFFLWKKARHLTTRSHICHTEFY
jgi:hypothetical protein